MEIKDVLLMISGLGLFLYGMKIMGEGLELSAGPKLKVLLEKLTKNRFMGMIMGMLITAVIQSSSATTVMVVGFVNAGLLNLTQAVSVIMGANVGTTITAQIIAFKIDQIAPIILMVGVVLILFFKKRSLNYIGQVLVGLGILFIGLGTMSDAMKPLREEQWFLELMIGVKNPLVGVLVGAAFTAVIQSSSASIGILQALALQGLIGLDSAVFILYGQNIGTCVTAILASIGASTAGKRAGVVHLLFNMIGALSFILLTMFTPFTEFMQALAPGDAVRQIANTHTLFNIITTVLLLPCVPLLVKLSCFIIPGAEPVAVGGELRLEFVDKRILAQPSIAVAQIRKELHRMYAIARENILLALDSYINCDLEREEEIKHNEELLDYLTWEVTNYLIKVNSMEIPESDNRALIAFHRVASDIERIGDHAENILENTQARKKQDLPLSDIAADELRVMHKKLDKIMTDSMTLFDLGTHNATIEASIKRQEAEIDEKTDEFKLNHIIRLNAGDCSPSAGIVFVDILTNLERAADHADNIAFALTRSSDVKN